MAGREELLDSMYASLRLEARIDYHLNSLENAYRLLRSRVAGEKSVGTIWFNTYEVVEEAVSKLRLIKSLLAKYRYTALYTYLVDALQLANELLIRIDSKPALPGHKDSVRVVASEVAYELRKILKKSRGEPDPSNLYSKAF